MTPAKRTALVALGAALVLALALGCSPDAPPKPAEPAQAPPAPAPAQPEAPPAAPPAQEAPPPAAELAPTPVAAAPATPPPAPPAAGAPKAPEPTAPAEPPKAAPEPPPPPPAPAAPAAPARAAVGDEKCAKMCHKVQYESWGASKHAKATPAVGCETCHGNGADYMKMAVMKDRAQALAAGLILPDRAACTAKCHKPADITEEKVKAVHAHKVK